MKLIAMAAVLLLVTGCDNSPEAQAKSTDSEAVKLCWQDYSKKSLDPGTKRFVAATCETMEANFAKKYGQRP